MSSLMRMAVRFNLIGWRRMAANSAPAGISQGLQASRMTALNRYEPFVGEIAAPAVWARSHGASRRGGAELDFA